MTPIATAAVANRRQGLTSSTDQLHLAPLQRGQAADAEARLVFALAGDAESGAIAALLAECDWGRLLPVASQENAAIVLRDAVREARPGVVPLAAQRQLAYMALQSEFRMRKLARLLETAVDTLGRVGIEATVLKGAALAPTLYGSFTARPMNDIDLLIDPDRAQEARALMLAVGWRRDPSLPGDEAYAGHHHLPPMLDGSGSGLRLELHTALLPRESPFPIANAELRRRATELPLGAFRVRVLGLVDHAVYAAIHFAWSHQLRLGAWHAMRDLGRLARRGLLDWPGFTDRAEEWRATSCAYWTLRLGRALAGLPVPGEVLRRLEPRLPEAILRRLERHFTQSILSRDEGCPSVRLERELWAIAMQPRRSGHGERRPWLASPALMLERQRLNPQRARSGTLEHLGHVVRWSRYLANML